MKILKPGSLKDKGQWWLGKLVICPECGLEAELELRDADRLVYSAGTCAHMLCVTEGCVGCIDISEP